MTAATVLTLLVVVTLMAGGVASAGVTPPFDVSLRGTFQLSFASGPGGTDVLEFHGAGIGSHLGVARVDGSSQLVADPSSGPGCSRIVEDAVTLTAADGSQLFITNDAVDCLDLSDPTHITIEGNGTYTITGGTGRFVGSTGTGTVHTEAVVEELTPSGASGRFDPLEFEGTVAP